jgi:hypothetical protein
MISDRSVLRMMWGVLAVLLFVPGCLLVTRTDHHVEILPDGRALVTVRYIDIRSDGETDSAAVRDLEILLDSFASAGQGEHLPPGVRLLEKHLGLQHDTLVAEVRLGAPVITAVEGFFLQDGCPTVLVPEGELIARTNGAVSRWHDGGLRIQWSDTTTCLEFDIQSLPATTGHPLARLYREHGTLEK